MVSIRFCRADELDKLQKFIDEKWRKGHRLGYDQDLMHWQHLNKTNNNIHFVIALDDEINKIIAILGFIPLSQYDNALESEKDLWLAIWKTDETNPRSKGTGIQLLEFLIEYYQPKSIGAIGINARVKKLYQALRFKTDVLQQYYFLNPEIKEYKIASAPAAAINVAFLQSDIEIKEIKELSSVKDLLIQASPKKSIDYCIQRYGRHPYYNYLFYGVYHKEKIETLWVIRKIEVNGSSCLRLVDMIGNLSLQESLSSQLLQLLRLHQAEYIDCLCYGIKEEIFSAQGFRKRTDSIIIPNYFEPFERRNIDIEFAYKTFRQEYIIFKGDSDQDRPN